MSTFTGRQNGRSDSDTDPGQSSSLRPFIERHRLDAHDAASSNIDVVYIAGNGRSGSTLLARLLGTPTNHIAVGELHDIWKEEWRSGEIVCSCGKQLLECEFWSAVATEASSAIGGIDGSHVLSLRKSTLSTRYLPLLAFPRLRTKSYQRRLEAYVEVLGATYRAVQKVSGCDVIVDSSKRPTSALVLREVPGIRRSMIHFIRDSRGCVYSWRKRGRRSTFFFTRRWVFNQVFSAVASRVFGTYCAYRYEDFAAQPREVLSDMARCLELDGDVTLAFVSDTDVMLSEAHVISGNTNRFQHGKITIRADLEWKDRMPAREQTVVALMTFPWLLKYRYMPAGRQHR